MAEPCATAQSATPTDGTSPSRWQKVWTVAKTVVNHFLNSADPACDADIIGFCFLLPFSIFWLHTRLKIDSQWAICFGVIWTAVGLKAFARRSGGAQ